MFNEEELAIVMANRHYSSYPSGVVLDGWKKNLITLPSGRVVKFWIEENEFPVEPNLKYKVV